MGRAATAGRSASTVVLGDCSFASLKSAVAAGGTIRDGVDCESPPVTLASTLAVPARPGARPGAAGLAGAAGTQSDPDHN